MRKIKPIVKPVEKKVKKPIETTELTEELVRAGFNPDLPENKQREYR